MLMAVWRVVLGGQGWMVSHLARSEMKACPGQFVTERRGRFQEPVFNNYQSNLELLL